MKRLLLVATLLVTALITLSCTQSFKKADSTGEYEGFGKDSVSDEVLKKYAPPPLPTETSRKIQSYLDLISPSSGILHPNGKSLYFSWRVTGMSQVWRVSSPMGFPEQLTGGEAKNSLADITPDGKYLVIQKDYDGEEMPGVYLQSAQGGELQSIQHIPKVETGYLFTTDDSRYIYFRANDVKPSHFNIYRYDLKTKTKELVFDKEGLWTVADYKKDGTLLMKKLVGNLEREFFEFDPKTQSLKPVIGQNEFEQYGVLFGANKNEYFVRTPKLGEFSTIYLLKNGKLRPITQNKTYNISGFTVDRKKTKIVYEIFKDGYMSVQAMDAKTFQPIRLPQYKDYEHTYMSGLSDDGKFLSLTRVNYNQPSSTFIYNFETKKLTQWNKSSAPEIDISKFVKATLESYPARDGTPIPMYVYTPKACQIAKLEKPCPVVVDFHGGPESTSLSGWDTKAQIYVEKGFIYAYPNVRGSDEYGKSWVAADNGPKRLNVISDIADAAIYFKKKYAINGVEPKVGITGGSYGGYSTFMGMSMFAGSYDAGAAVVGMSNLVTFLKNTAPQRRPLRETEYGFLDKDMDALIKLSASSYIDRIKGPLLIIQGANDPRVPAGEAVQIQETLQDRGLDSKLILFADEGHGASKRSNRALQMGHIVEFFTKHLKGAKY